MRTASAAEMARYVYKCYVCAAYNVFDNITHKVPYFLAMLMHLKKKYFWKNIDYRNNSNNLVLTESETWILGEISGQQ